MFKNINLKSAFNKKWLLQTLFIIFAVLISIFTITWILEKSLVKQALELEADAFIAQYQEDKSFPLPRTRNLIGYLVTPDSQPNIPTEIKSLSPGLYTGVEFSGRDETIPVYIRSFENNTLYLVFEGGNIDRLVGVFGLVPMSFLLILIYTSSWIAYRITWRAVSPILNIARDIRESDTDNFNFSLDLPTKKFSGDTKELVEALDDYAKRIDVFVDRERQFTADISHELRTPMTIIDGAAQFLEIETNISEKSAQRVKMIRRACRDVNDLTSAFFLLAREQSDDAQPYKTNVANIIEEQVIKYNALIDSSRIEVIIDVLHPLVVNTYPKALEIIIGNVLSNAIKYTTEGKIEITVSENEILVCDTGMGIPEDLLPELFQRHVRGRGLSQAGEGIGLAIVKRLCDQFDWDITIENNIEDGITVSLKKLMEETA